MRITATAVASTLLIAMPIAAQRPEPRAVATIDGDVVYEVLPVGAIPALSKPVFLTGRAADVQMRPEEPILGIEFGDEARAYSLWQLDAHEIVNDQISGTAIAATW